MSLLPQAENTPDGRGGVRDSAGGGLRAFLNGRRVIWLFLAAAAIHSIVPAKLLLADFGGGSVPGIAMLVLIVFAVVWLVVVWVLVAVAAVVRRTGVRAVILVILLLPYPLELSLLGEGITSVSHLRDDPKIDTQTDRDLGAAIWACDWHNRNEDVTCDLDKIAALTAKTDTSKPSSLGVSLMF